MGDSAYRQRHREKGLCEDCVNPALPGSKYCEYHKDKYKKLWIENKKRRNKEGRCNACGRPLQIEEIGIFKTCIVCRTWRTWRYQWN